MLTTVFKARPDRQISQKSSSKAHFNQLKELMENFKSLKRIKPVQFFTYFCCCWKRERKEYHSKLRQAQKVLVRELDLERFLRRQRMQTTAILGLLNRTQIMYATRMSRLVTFEDKQALLSETSDLSSSANESDPFDGKTSSKSTYYNKLAKDLVKSSNRVDKRFMKLHEMHAYPNRKTSLLEMLGFNQRLSQMFPRAVSPQSKQDYSQKY